MAEGPDPPLLPEEDRVSPLILVVLLGLPIGLFVLVAVLSQ